MTIGVPTLGCEALVADADDLQGVHGPRLRLGGGLDVDLHLRAGRGGPRPDVSSSEG
jgi:hypothetical protein